MRVLVTGATGFIGKRLSERLVSEGHELVALTRDPIVARERLPSPYDAYAWNFRKGPPVQKALEGVDWVFHLAGESVGGHRWSGAQKREILESRVLSTRHLFEGLQRVPGRKPAVVIAASAIGFYGDRGDEILTEAAPAGRGFLAEVCQAWEAEARRGLPSSDASATRLVQLRTGMVLGKGGGALEKLVPLFQRGMGGKAGSGRQWLSWIELDDLVDLLLFVATHDSCRGVLNAVAPNPVTNAEFSATLARRLGKPAHFHAPAFAVKLAMGEMAELVLASQRVSSEKVRELGFRFQVTELPQALEKALTALP